MFGKVLDFKVIIMNMVYFFFFKKFRVQWQKEEKENRIQCDVCYNKEYVGDVMRDQRREKLFCL